MDKSGEQVESVDVSNIYWNPYNNYIPYKTMKHSRVSCCLCLRT